jgi:RNA polymerase sigma-70 factor (ECF subfamily)
MARLSATADGPLVNNLARLAAHYERAILPHLDAAHDLARWLTRCAQDAEDVVQEACLRAFRFFESFNGGDARAWLLAIVRNTCYTWLQKNKAQGPRTSFDLQWHDVASTDTDPEELLRQQENSQMLRDVLGELPADFRAVIVLRELEGCSYKEIAFTLGIPQGTVMSRLARARQRLTQLLLERGEPLSPLPGSHPRNAPAVS